MLARVELNDGLTLPQLLTLSGRLLPRNATVIVFLPAVTPETALALGSLRRRSYHIIVMLVAMEEIPRGRGRTSVTRRPNWTHNLGRLANNPAR